MADIILDYGSGNPGASMALNAFREGKMVHAYLLSGAKGLGKRTLATALACLLLRCRRRAWVAVLAPVLCNGVLVGAMLAWVSLPTERFLYGLALFGGEVALGELAVMLLLGLPLLLLLRRTDLLHRLGL